jgi:hypothetical protein
MEEPEIVTDPTEERIRYLERFTEDSKADRGELRRALHIGRVWRAVAWFLAVLITALGFWQIHEQQHEACRQRAEARTAVRDLVRFVISFKPDSPAAQRLTVYLRDSLSPIDCNGD